MAVQSKLALAIRAIVGSRDEKSRDLTLKTIRDSITGNRGIGYMFPDGLNAGGVSGKAGITILGISLGNLSQFATNEEIEKIKALEENKTKSITEVLNMFIGQKAMAIDGLEDCATGKDVEVVNTPQFKNPEGWLGPNDPGPALPAYQKFTLGMKWAGSGLGTTTFLIPYEAATASRDAAGDGAFSVIDGEPTHEVDGFGTDFWRFHFRNPALPPGSLPVQYLAIGAACVPHEIDATCPLGYKYIWPVDNKMQLARQTDGKFIYSTNEPAGDIIPAYTDNQHTKLDLCFNDGSGRKASIEATRNGGWIVYETLDGLGVGIATVVDSTNTVIDKIDVRNKSEVTVSFT